MLAACSPHRCFSQIDGKVLTCCLATVEVRCVNAAAASASNRNPMPSMRSRTPKEGDSANTTRFTKQSRTIDKENTSNECIPVWITGLQIDHFKIGLS